MQLTGSGSQSQQPALIASPRHLRSLASKMKLYSLGMHKHDESADTPINFCTRSKCGCCPVLVVDDNEFNIYTLTQMIKISFNLDPDTAFDGHQAVEKFKESCKCCPYRLIFMDINMPVMDGHEATKMIRKVIESTRLNEEVDVGDLESQCSGSQATTKIYALTANHDKHEHDEAMKCGMDGFLTKPTNITTVK